MLRLPMIDLRLNYPVLAGQAAQLHGELMRLGASEHTSACSLPPYAGDSALRQVAADWLSRPGYPVLPSQTIVCVGGHHELTVVFAGGSTARTRDSGRSVHLSTRGPSSIRI